jgi:multimeric flavodoxin WrbA
MKIIGILGSPRKGGNTETLLDVALREAKKNGVSTDKISLKDKVIGGCKGCLKCTRTGKCVIQDDMQGIYTKMLESDGILWATPVYFWSMSSQIKTVLDRTFALTFPKLQLASKIGGLILVAGSRGCVNTANIFHMYFNYNHMFFAEFASGYAWEKGEIKKNAFAMNAAKEMVRQMISLIQANLKYPEEFDAPMPRFVKKKYQL